MRVHGGISNAVRIVEYLPNNCKQKKSVKYIDGENSQELTRSRLCVAFLKFFVARYEAIFAGLGRRIEYNGYVGMFPCF